MTPRSAQSAIPLAERPLGSTIGLHLLPGILATGAYLLFAPSLMARGFPSLLGLLLVTLFVLIPFELGYLLDRARREHGTVSFDGIVTLREPLPASQYVIWPLLLFAWGIASSALASPLEQALRRGLFGWLPSWYAPTSLADFASYSRPVLVATFVLGFVVVGLVGPIVEELYFRGHLLPRLDRLGRWSPLVHAVLFSVYHLWTPWQNPSRILLMVPLTYLVRRKRNIYLGMLAHCGLNAIVWSITFGAIVRAAAP